MQCFWLKIVSRQKISAQVICFQMLFEQGQKINLDKKNIWSQKILDNKFLLN